VSVAGHLSYDTFMMSRSSARCNGCLGVYDTERKRERQQRINK
jgi:hypothetical protein